MAIVLQTNKVKSPNLKALMKSYQEVFHKPKCLPPTRTHDIFIPLKLWA